MSKHRPYGTYSIGHDMPNWYIKEYYLDCADAQDFLPQGYRIRNKKAKRRLHNKRTRQIAITAMLAEVAEHFIN